MASRALALLAAALLPGIIRQPAAVDRCVGATRGGWTWVEPHAAVQLLVGQNRSWSATSVWPRLPCAYHLPIPNLVSQRGVPPGAFGGHRDPGDEVLPDLHVSGGGSCDEAGVSSVAARGARSDCQPCSGEGGVLEPGFVSRSGGNSNRLAAAPCMRHTAATSP